MNKQDKQALSAGCELFEALNAIAARYNPQSAQTGLFVVLLAVATGAQREPELLASMMRSKAHAERLHVLVTKAES